MNRQLTVGIVAIVVLAVAGGLYFMLRPSTGPQPITGPERAEDARGVIAELEQAAAPDYDKAFSDAQAFQKAGQLADAQLLYFFGARANHAPSAFELATMNDPNHHSSATSLLPKPDPFQAYKWYSVARDHGMAAASQRLEELHSWAMKAAEEGDAEAERLLLQWKN